MSQMKVVAFILLGMLLSYGCSNSTDTGETFVPPSGHPENWANPDYIGSDNFHGNPVAIAYSIPKGPALFSIRCAGCHGSNGSGYIGPNIQGASSTTIKNAMNSVAYMLWLGRFSTDEDIQAIADYLGNLNTTSTYTVDANTCAECHGEDFNGGIAKIACYSCHKGPEGTVGHSSEWSSEESDSVHFHSKYANSYLIACKACHGPDLNGPGNLNCYNCHESENPPTGTVSFSTNVQPIFDNNCISCHTSGGQASFMPLTSDVSYTNLVNQSATNTGCPTVSGTRVIPYDSANSILYQRISGIGLPSCESTMPLGGSLLSSTDQNTIKNWIDQGAGNN